MYVTVIIVFQKIIILFDLVILATLTVLKMLRVTRNERFTKSTIERICRTIWIVVFVCFSTEYAVFRAGGSSGGSGL